MSRRDSALVLTLCLAAGGRAAAQTFPATAAYVPLACGAAPMVDGVADTAGAAGALDLVGTAPFPAGFHAADAQFLYLRMRLGGSPLTGNALQSNAWGFEFDLDGDRTTYELLITASGVANPNEVAIYRHPTTATPNDPADPAALPAAFTYAFATHGRTSVADSMLSGAPDAFLELAVPWADLATVGVQRDTPVYVWAGSSTVGNALDLDLACFGGAGGTLSGIDVGRTTPDPNAGGGGSGGTGGGGGGGTSGGGTGPRTLEGGLGCSMSGHAASPSAAASSSATASSSSSSLPLALALTLLVVALATRARRRRA